MKDTCFICSRNSYDFEHAGVGFDDHVNQEHNMWAYIFFFIRLLDTKSNDYTALDLHVSTQVSQLLWFQMINSLENIAYNVIYR